MIIRKRDKEILKNYKAKIERIQQWCIDNDEFNIYQLEMMMYFFGRAIQYCRIPYKGVFKKENYVRQKSVLASSKQLAEYSKVDEMLKRLKFEITNDSLLDKKIKKQFLMSLTYICGHVRGKLNRKLGEDKNDNKGRF